MRGQEYNIEYFLFTNAVKSWVLPPSLAVIATSGLFRVAAMYIYLGRVPLQSRDPGGQGYCLV